MRILHYLRHGFQELIYAFPIHRLIYNIKNHLAIVAFWVLLAMWVGGYMGKTYGTVYVFLGPEYLNEESFWSFLMVGLALGGFIITFHITGYILDAYRYNFLSAVHKPFLCFCVNNSLLPLGFVVYYGYLIIGHQLDYEHAPIGEVVIKMLGFLTGIALMVILVSVYFTLTNRRVLLKFADRLDRRLKRGRLQRVNVMERLNKAKKERITINSYIDISQGIHRVNHEHEYDKVLIVKVFDQTQLNAFIIQIISVLSLFLLGIYRDIPLFQLPAAASVFLLLSILLMLLGAIGYWFKEWAIAVSVIATALLFHFFPVSDANNPYHQAFGIDYTAPPASYTLDTIKALSNEANFRKDHLHTLGILERWKKRAQLMQGTKDKPKMVFVCASGGGLLASLWTLRSLQYLDSASGGQLMPHTAMMAGSSGGAIGEAYFRELYLRWQEGKIDSLYSPIYPRKIALDKLNPTVFSFVVADFMFRFQQFQLGDKVHYRDRGYSLERQFLIDIDSVLDKPIAAYREPELNAKIPLMFIAPTIVNDGRKLYISPQPISYMNLGQPMTQDNREMKVLGVEFRRLFAAQQADSLRFMTALRMNATFPYITPNVVLPSKPAISIMDAGLADNFGVSDALHFMYVFREWINTHTSGVVVLSLRVLPREEGKKEQPNRGTISQLFAPISGVLGNIFAMQDMDNERELEYMGTLLKVPLHQINFEYINASNKEEIEEASLSWRLTKREQAGILDAVSSPYNQSSLKRLQDLLKAE